MHQKIILEGTVARGFGEGTYFMSIQHYQDEIRKKLGFEAYPGTLNIRVTKKQAGSLKKLNSIKIEGFKSNNKTFGGADCYQAKIKNLDGAIIVPNLTKHKNIVEFIAPIHVKSELKLKDGGKVKVELI